MPHDIQQEIKIRVDHYREKNGRMPTQILLGRNRLSELGKAQRGVVSDFMGVKVVPFDGYPNRIQVG